MAWIFGTGNAVTLPLYEYEAHFENYNIRGESTVSDDLINIESLGEKNAFRMSDYHRLDLSIEFRKTKKWGERAWVFSVYNAYWHRNPYFIIADSEFTFDQNGIGRSKPVFKEISILPIIPSFAYKFKF